MGVLPCQSEAVHVGMCRFESVLMVATTGQYLPCFLQTVTFEAANRIYKHHMGLRNVIELSLEVTDGWSGWLDVVATMSPANIPPTTYVSRPRRQPTTHPNEETNITMNKKFRLTGSSGQCMA